MPSGTVTSTKATGFETSVRDMGCCAVLMVPHTRYCTAATAERREVIRGLGP